MADMKSVGMVSLIREFGMTVLGDAVFAAMSGKGVSEQGKKTPGAVLGGVLSSELKDTWFGLGLDDEAAYFRAKSTLQGMEDCKAISEMVGYRLEHLNDLVLNQKRALILFRRILSKLTEEEAVDCLRYVGDASDEDWKDFVESSGLAVEGNFARLWKFAKEKLGFDFSKIRDRLMRLDDIASANLDKVVEAAKGASMRIGKHWRNLRQGSPVEDGSECLHELGALQLGIPPVERTSESEVRQPAAPITESPQPKRKTLNTRIAVVCVLAVLGLFLVVRLVIAGYVMHDVMFPG